MEQRFLLLFPLQIGQAFQQEAVLDFFHRLPQSLQYLFILLRLQHIFCMLMYLIYIVKIRIAREKDDLTKRPSFPDDIVQLQT